MSDAGEHPEDTGQHEELRMHPPPPADFGLLIESFAAQAMTALGKVPDPMTGATGVNLPWARYFIDLLALLERKTAGNLEPHERSRLQAHLSTLRLNYVDTAKGQPPAEQAGTD